MKLFPLRMSETESPPASIVRGYVRDRIGLVRQRVEMWLELGQGHPFVNRRRVADHVKVALREVDNAAALFILYVRAPDVPLVGHRPVECPRARRNLMDRQLRQN